MVGVVGITGLPGSGGTTVERLTGLLEVNVLPIGCDPTDEVGGGTVHEGEEANKLIKPVQLVLPLGGR